MPENASGDVARVVAEHEREILDRWMEALKQDGTIQTGRIKEAELQTQCGTLLRLLRQALATGADPYGSGYDEVRAMVEDMSRSRAVQGFSPAETAIFVFSLKQPIFQVMTKNCDTDTEALTGNTWSATQLIDQLGLLAIETYQKTREEVIIRQQQEISELSTPVVKLWDGVLALPLIGTLDSARTQVVMESLLQSIVDQEAEIAIIDITGVPTVDTLVAQHLLKTIAAARLMGADCIISGIRPQIAQTMVHIGVELNVVSKATLAEAFALALKRTGQSVVRARSLRGAQANADPES